MARTFQAAGAGAKPLAATTCLLAYIIYIYIYIYVYIYISYHILYYIILYYIILYYIIYIILIWHTKTFSRTPGPPEPSENLAIPLHRTRQTAAWPDPPASSAPGSRCTARYPDA